MKKHTLLVFVLFSLFVNILKAQNTENYNRSQVRIGGGGYITGIKIHPNNQNVAYWTCNKILDN